MQVNRMHSRHETAFMCDRGKKKHPPITTTFFPDGNFDRERVDTSLNIDDLNVKEHRVALAFKSRCFIEYASLGSLIQAGLCVPARLGQFAS